MGGEGEQEKFADEGGGAGCGLRVRGCGLRVRSSALRVPCCVFRVYLCTYVPVYLSTCVPVYLCTFSRACLSTFRVTREQVGDECFERLAVEDEAEGGGETELEAHVLQVVGVEERHERRNREEGDEAVLAAAKMTGKQGGQSHDRGAHHGRVRADQQGVEADADGRGHRAAARAEQPAKEGQEQFRDDGNVKSRNSDDVRSAGIFEVLLQVGGQAAIHAEQDARQQRGFRVREQKMNGGKGFLFERVQPGGENVAIFPRQGGDVRAGHGRVDALAGEVVAVGEILVFRRGLEFAAQADDIAVCVILVGVHAGQQESVHFQVVAVAGVNAGGAHAQVGVGIAQVRRFCHPAGDEGVVVAVVVPGQVEGAENGDRNLVARRAEEQDHQEKRGGGDVFGERGQVNGLGQETPQDSQRERDDGEQEPHRNRQGGSPGGGDSNQKGERDPEERARQGHARYFTFFDLS